MKFNTVVQAMATPLASIFGSGFLIIVPILAAAVGPYSPFAIIGVCAVAYAVGSVIRFNIMTVEPVLAGYPPRMTLMLERLSDVSIVIAYVISICLYLHLMSAFVLTGIGADSPFAEDIMTTGVILIIIAIGMIKGLRQLESLEKWALYCTLMIVALLLAGFAQYDWVQGQSTSGLQFVGISNATAWEIATIVGGTLIVVQGFETTRYLGDTYDAATRIKASRWSQIFASAIYVLFVLLAMPVVHTLQGNYTEDSLINLTQTTAAFLVIPLVTAAALSQFSAAVADMIAGLGNLEEVSGNRISTHLGYILIGGGALVITWSADTLELVAFASRAFAFYYLLQCLSALSVTTSRRHKAFLIVLSFILIFVAIFAVPAG